MAGEMTCKDVHGNDVRVGSRVRLLDIDPCITDPLPQREQRDIQSLKGRVLEVDEIHEKCAYVTAEWDRGDGLSESHRFPLWPEHMEVVEG
jgi:hypothetical protein